ncbi:MAG: chaperone NapD [Candidatus Electrothrix sp. Rat3]|nr:chaperone NapD [Candidatus Electrothrix rattekaaiensis]
MNISGIVVQVSPDKSAAVQKQLGAFSGVELHAVNKEKGSLVITLEDTPGNVPADIMMNIQNIQGVLAASLIYNYCDE